MAVGGFLVTDNSSSQYTARLFHHGKASKSAEQAGIAERLNCSGQRWQSQIVWFGGDRLLDRFYASSRAKLWKIGERLVVSHLGNLTGCPI